MTYRTNRNAPKNKYGFLRSYTRQSYRSDLSPQALIWDRAAREFQEELDDALRAYTDGLIPRREYLLIRDRLRDAIAAAQERAENYRRSGLARSGVQPYFGTRKRRW